MHRTPHRRRQRLSLRICTRRNTSLWSGGAWLPSAVFLGAVATSSCGIGPQIIFSLGIGAGPWIANLTALAPYTPLSVAGTVGFLDYRFFLGLLEAQRA
ncbi:mercuric transporter MerT family protein [Sphingopyxis sp. SE2]|uniref:mercuric transporter MerT family protein n=1 Tax=Sphingopyxis sp. SE2 TaxID=1586240 RepID=UPI0028C32A12|nr:mercuric transporter MerT family protein [Sphingopyxis sp. SE2]MDT7531232.1 mercuric transporter MerT family protein [Sphingopyxis sp. SE2]